MSSVLFLLFLQTDFHQFSQFYPFDFIRVDSSLYDLLSLFLRLSQFSHFNLFSFTAMISSVLSLYYFINFIPAVSRETIAKIAKMSKQDLIFVPTCLISENTLYKNTLPIR